MPRDSDHDIAVLENLILTSEDGIRDFRACANAVRDSEAKAFFNDRVQLIDRGLTELRNEVRRLGGDPEARSAGAARGTAIEAESALTGKDDGAVLTECARAEDAAVTSYEDALRQDLSPEVRAIVERQLGGVLENRDRVRTLRDRVSAPRSGTAREAERGAPPPM
jgi:uncharacterized protein (TIGR02284 family)